MKNIRRFRALLPTLIFACGVHSALALNCGDPVSGNVKLTADLHCNNTDGLHVVADNTVIDLNGHTIACKGTGFAGSCQKGGVSPAGISSINHKYVQIVGPGMISGFTIGVSIGGGEGNLVKNLVITGPPQINVATPRQRSYGIAVEDTTCPINLPKLAPVRAAWIEGNEVSNQTRGIELLSADCVSVLSNNIHDNNGDSESAGIVFDSSAYGLASGNFVHANGSNHAGLDPDGGIEMIGPTAQHNQVTSNSVLNNCGHGIATLNGARNNTTALNVSRFNATALGKQCRALSADHPFYDLAQIDQLNQGPGTNTWNTNNLCRTENSAVPSTVCNPGE